MPRGDGRYVLGATSEERGFDTTVTAGAAFELLRDATELVPGVSELVIDEFAAGLRPGDPGQPARDRRRARSPACTGRPATTATGSCWRRSTAELVVRLACRRGRRTAGGAVRPGALPTHAAAGSAA